MHKVLAKYADWRYEVVQLLTALSAKLCGTYAVVPSQSTNHFFNIGT
jgi:hypothetical protein